jgi:hypothetical protein
MLEAWLLFDELAIRRASGNPSGTMRLDLPPFRAVETVANPKAMLHGILRDASGLHGRRLKSFNPNTVVCRIPDYIEDFQPLRALSAFERFEDEVKAAVTFLASNH